MVGAADLNSADMCGVGRGVALERSLLCIWGDSGSFAAELMGFSCFGSGKCHHVVLGLAP